MEEAPFKGRIYCSLKKGSNQACLAHCYYTTVIGHDFLARWYFRQIYWQLEKSTRGESESGDDLGEDLGELVLSLNSDGETYPALFELCQTSDLRASSLWIGVPIFLVILNLWILSDILNVECAVSVNSAFVNFIVLPVHWK